MQKTKEDTAENEIRVAAGGQVSKYLGYAFRILNRSDFNSVTIRATGNAIVKALILIELVKRRIGNLHQLSKIHSMMILDKYEPKVEGLEPIEQSRRVTAFDCVLSKEPLDETDPGYQPPKEAEERTPNNKPSHKPAPATPATAPRGRGRGTRARGETGPRPARRYNDDSEVAIESHDRRHAKYYDERRADEPNHRGRGRGEHPMRARGRGAPRGTRGVRGGHEEPREPVRPPRERSADRGTAPPRRGADRRDRR